MNFYANYLAIKRYWPSPKLLLIMKLTVLWMFLALMQASAGSFAQKISLNERNTSLAKVLDNIKKQSGYVFLYEDIDVEKIKVNVQVKDASIDQALTASLKSQALTYKIVDKTVMIRKKETSILDKLLDYFSAIDVKGKVLDEEGRPLGGASVKVKGSTLATLTDIEGEFFLKGVSEDATIVIVYLGYKSLELKAMSSMGVLKLELATSLLNEVKINGGYYETTDKLKTGNIARVTAKDIENQPVTSPLLSLQGRVAGLDISPKSGTPGSAPVIRIRGTNSLRINGKTNGLEEDGNYPLYIVDGIPISATPLEGAGDGPDGKKYSSGFDPLSTINTENIESIEVLKDGDATAIYGSRGANGVILITTKRNNKNYERTNLDFKLYQGAGVVSHQMKLLNTRQYLDMRYEAFRNDGIKPDAYELILWDTTSYTNWQEVLLGGTARITDVQSAISSGSKNTMFNIGAAYHKESLVTPGDFGYQKLNGFLSFNHISIDQRFKVSISTNYAVDISKMFGGNLVANALELPPNAPKLLHDDGNINWEIRNTGGGIGTTFFNNPIAHTLRTNKSVNRSLISTGNLSYVIFPGVSASINLGLTDFTGSDKLKGPIASLPPAYVNGQLISGTGNAAFVDNKRNSWIIEPKITFSKQWSGHRFNVLGGATWQNNISLLSRINGSGYVSDALLGSIQGAKDRTILDLSTEYKFLSLYGRIGYNFSDRYLLNLTARRDGSSRFGPDKRFGNFGAVGAAWIFSNEKIIGNALKFLSFGKIRGSYGITGSDNIGNYKYYNLYDVSGTQYQGFTSLSPNSLFNPNYAWEITRKLEGGIEFSIFSNRISTEISWYQNRSSNQLVDYPLPATTGFDSVLQNFGATVQNTGWEILLRGDILNLKSLSWNISFNISMPKNKLIRFDGIEDSPYKNLYKVGEPLSIRNLYHYKGVNPQTGVHEVLDRNNDGLINDLDRTLGSPMDKAFYGGLNNTIRYKNIELSFLFQFTSTKSTRYFALASIYNQPTTILERWQKPGDITTVQRYSTNYSADAYNGSVYLLNSDGNITDASFLRLKTVSLSYQVPANWLSRIKSQQAQIFLHGQNLYTISPYNGLDPETGSGLPPLRMVTAGIQFKF